MFQTKTLPVKANDIAPDTSDVRILLDLESGGLAHFELGPGKISKATCHKTVGEIWYILNGRGQMWRKYNEREEVVDLNPGVSLTIPVGTHFQFRSYGFEPLSAIGVTIPRWPGKDEAYFVDGRWDGEQGKK